MAVTTTQSRGDSTNERLPERPAPRARLWKNLRLTPSLFGMILLFGLFYLFLSRRPLWHTDLWGHLAYGRLIVATRALPPTEPLMPLARGMPFVDLSWLSQVSEYAAFRWEGIAAIQSLYAASITAALGLLAWRTARKTGSLGPALLAGSLFIGLEWQQFLIVRPQLAGLVCFLLLFVSLTGKKPGRRLWLFVPLLFVLWTNLHGSFYLGLALIAAMAAGRGCDLVRRRPSFGEVLRDGKCRSLCGLLVLAGAAVLLNPYGWRIFPDVWLTASNPNLADLVEWRPLDIQMRQGQAASLVGLALVVLYRLTPRRISCGEVFLLVGLGAAMLRSSRMIVWWSPVASFYVALHAAAVWRRYRLPERTARFAASPTWALAAAVMIGGVASCSPLGLLLLEGRRPDPLESLSPQTPLGATDFLNAHPLRGQIFNTYEWGDYLMWAGPPGLRVFVASHAHLVPVPVWQDYIRVITLKSGWEQILDHYEVSAAVLDADQHVQLVDALRAKADWSVAYEDDRSAVLVRAQRAAWPMGGQKKSSGPLQQ